MTITELRALAKWHEERAAVLQSRINDGTHAMPLKEMKERRSFHTTAAIGLKSLADAFVTLSALHDR